ncbi:ParB/RepB/Spo0J family partition protein [Nakamurella flavida]|uniref:ParB/RepB/Spo0J family partition protein n=2 Tax=Nakamurella flavida TaxID=363630 RepID=A0A939C379_9ACTN|nr:ParB/RepB/Spo0J family partition protein [Nakamurella flavida]
MSGSGTAGTTTLDRPAQDREPKQSNASRAASKRRTVADALDRTVETPARNPRKTPSRTTPVDDAPARAAAPRGTSGRRTDADSSRSRDAAAASPADAPVSNPDEVTSPAGTDTDGPQYREVAVGDIRPNPRNPRAAFDEEALEELAHSVREFGLLQPVVVRPVDGGYELVMGERRWRAAQQAGLAVIPAIVRRTEDSALLRDALLENIHRANLNPLEEAAAYQQLLEEFDVTQDELATRLGRSRPVISNTIRLLRLPVAVQRRVAAGVLSAGHARALLSLPDADDQELLAARIVAEGLSVRGTEEAVTLLLGRGTVRRRSTPARRAVPGLPELASDLSDTFETRVRVEMGKAKGRIVVEFATGEDLSRILAVMAPTVAAGHGQRTDTGA